MKNSKVAIGLSLTLAASTVAIAGYNESVGIDEFRGVESTYRLRASDIIGRDVINKGDDEIGEVDDIVIGGNKEIHAVLSVGGFLGMGEKHVLVPYSELRLGRDDDIVYYDSTEDKLEALPEFVYNEGELPGVQTMGYRADQVGDIESDVDIDWEVIDAKWEQFKARVQQKWGELTDDDWAIIDGKREELVAKLQEATGRTEAEVSEEVNDIIDSLE